MELNKQSCALSDIDRLYSQNDVVPSALNSLKLKFKYIREGELLCHYLMCKKNELDTELHLEKCQLWRQKTFPLTSIDCYDDMSKILYIHGTDIHGHPLIIFTPGYNNPKTRNLEVTIRWIIYLLEVATRQLPKHLLQFTCLVNRSVGPIDADVELAQRVNELFRTYYPFRMFRFYLYPVNIVLRGVINLIKQFYERGKQTIRPIASLEALREVIPDEYIPRNLGGSCDYKFKMEDFPNPFVHGYITTFDEVGSSAAVATGMLISETGEVMDEDEYLQDIYEDNSMTNNANNPNAINQPGVSVYFMNALNHLVSTNTTSEMSSDDTK